MTLSEAREAFRQTPSHSSAHVYLEAAIVTWEDDRLSTETFVDVVSEVSDWLKAKGRTRR
jgi:hypothetical protein